MTSRTTMTPKKKISKKTQIKKIVLLDFLKEGAISREQVTFGGHIFEITEHRIGWDFDTAEHLIQKYDGHVDGIALHGVQKKVSAGRVVQMHPGYRRLSICALNTPLFVTDGLRDFFADWTLQRLLKTQPDFFKSKTVLFHAAVATPAIKKVIQAQGRILAADALLLTGVPKLLTSSRQLELLLRIAQFSNLRPKILADLPQVQKVLDNWHRKADVVYTFSALLEMMTSVDSLRGKTLIVDCLKPEMAERLKSVGVEQVIELIPHKLIGSEMGSRPLVLINSMLELNRLSENSLQSGEEYMIDWIQEHQLEPNPLSGLSQPTRRCAFIVHALSQKDLWRHPLLKTVEKLPKRVKDALEYAGARVPIVYYGSIQGIKSEHDGQEVICDLYGMMATPRQLLSMNENFVYKRLISAAEKAKSNGARMIGLGAYTKVVGDAGVTVARGSPIPVTTGNSFSASTTLWAAREMVEKMGMISGEKDGQRLDAKCMIIGATGSIGRVSALLTALVFKELVLVAPQLDKLLELKQEIESMAPGLKIRVATNPNLELGDTDLVVTATSNTDGQILDMERVKPGAVICDCSRPLDIGAELAATRPDVMVIESGEVLLPGNVKISCDIGLPKPSVYACLAETVLLTMEGRYENFSISRNLSMHRVKEIYRLAAKHGARLSEVRGPAGIITAQQIVDCRNLAKEKLKTWTHGRASRIGDVAAAVHFEKALKKANAGSKISKKSLKEATNESMKTTSSGKKASRNPELVLPKPLKRVLKAQAVAKKSLSSS